MKSKIFRVLIALVLVLTFSVVTAVPAGAAEAEYTLITGGVGVAEWSADEYLTGSYSLKLFAPAATGDYGKVVMPLDIEFEDFADFSVWVEGGAVAAQALPLHDIKAVVDDVAGVTLPASNKGTGEGVDLQNKIVVLASQPGQSEALSPTLMSDGIDGWEKYGTHSGADIDVGTGAYWSIFVYSAAYVYEAAYDYYTWEQIHSVLDGKATVTEVRIELRYPQDPADVASTVYVDDIVINETTYAMEQPAAVWVATTGDDANPGTEAEPFLTIQHAIDILAGDCIVNVAAGTYTENVNVDVSLTLQGESSTTVTVNAADSNVSIFKVTASNVNISGFTVSGATGGGQAGIYLDAGVTLCNISSNNLTGSFDGIWLGAGSNHNTLENNTLTNNYQGFEVYISDYNTFTGNIANSNTNYGFKIDSGNYNEFTSNIANSNAKFGFYVVIGDGGGCNNTTFTRNTANLNTTYGIRINGGSGNTLTGNTFDSNGTSGIRLKETMTTLTLENNNFTSNPIGIEITDSVADVSTWTVNYNNIVGNTSYGVSNNASTGTLDAEYNWYGGVAGPQHSTNPYNTQAGTQGNDSVSDDVDFLPWMIHTELVSGWNIYSTPIAPGALSNTVEKALDLWGSGTDNYTIGYYFDSATQNWIQVLSTTALAPMQAVYLKMTAAATVDVAVSAEYTSPPQVVMSAGWNLIGPSALEPMQVDDALLSALYGAGAPELWGYSQVHSPALHQTLWTFQRGDTTFPNLIPTEGYWVHMVNAGLLAGFTSTPIEP